MTFGPNDDGFFLVFFCKLQLVLYHKLLVCPVYVCL